MTDDRHPEFDHLLAVWNGSADVDDLDLLVTADYVGYIGSRRRDLSRLKADIQAYRDNARDVAFCVEEQFQSGDQLATRLTARARRDGEADKTIRGLNISRWRNGLLAEEWALWESFEPAGD